MSAASLAIDKCYLKLRGAYHGPSLFSTFLQTDIIIRDVSQAEVQLEHTCNITNWRTLLICLLSRPLAPTVYDVVIRLRYLIEVLMILVLAFLQMQLVIENEFLTFGQDVDYG